MKLEVHFNIKGIPNSFIHIIEVNNMDDDVINKTLLKDVQDYLNHGQMCITKFALSIFFIKELTC